MQAELEQVIAERDAAMRVSEEAMRMLSDVQLAELRQRLDDLDKGIPAENASE